VVAGCFMTVIVIGCTTPEDSTELCQAMEFFRSSYDVLVLINFPLLFADARRSKLSLARGRWRKCRRSSALVKIAAWPSATRSTAG
jgi:hypothetical protein